MPPQEFSTRIRRLLARLRSWTRSHEDARAASAVSERRDRELFERSPAITVVVDPRLRRIVDANDAAARWYGFPRAELVGMHVSEINPLPLDHLEQITGQILAGEVSEFLLPQRLRSGEIRQARAFISPVASDAGPLFYSILFDVTEQQRIEAELRESEQRFRLMADEAPVLIAISDAQARTTFVNRNWLELTGRPFSLEPGHGWPDLIHPEDRARVLAESVAAAEGLRSYEIEYRVRRADGEWRWVLDRGVPRMDGAGTRGVPAGFLGHACIAIDITDRKLFEERQRESQRMEAMGRLAGGIAHDLNNILTVVLGSAELLLKLRGDDVTVRENAAEVHAAAERAAQLVAQLLTFTRRQVLAPVDLDLHDSLIAMGGLLRRVIGEDVELVTATQPGAGAVRMDPAQFTQMVLNLAINARHAMPHGGQLVVATKAATFDAAQARAAHLARAGEWLGIEVRDAGAGMDEATRARMFAPFLTTKADDRHAGLGLATVKAIVDQCGGAIEVESAPGSGTCVRVWLPRVKSASGAPKPADVVAAPAPAPQRGLATVLLVEDDSAVRPLLCRYLQSGGYRVIEAIDGLDALVQARAHAPIDVVVTDVVMPQMGGRKFAERLREEQPAADVLYMSGYTDDEVLRHGVSHEERPFLHKPFGRDELLRKVAALLAARRGAGPPATMAKASGA